MDKDSIEFNFYKDTLSLTPDKPVLIQQYMGLEISFVMPVPIDKTGCYLKIKFPRDIALPDPNDDNLALTYQSAEDNMMSNIFGEDVLNEGI